MLTKRTDSLSVSVWIFVIAIVITVFPTSAYATESKILEQLNLLQMRIDAQDTKIREQAIEIENLKNISAKANDIQTEKITAQVLELQMLRNNTAHSDDLQEVVSVINPSAGEESDLDSEYDSADGTLTATVALVSDYRHRGISRSDENIALQGGLEWEHYNGLYAGVWTSNLNFRGTAFGDRELVPYAGYRHYMDDTTVDAAIKWYDYPNERPGFHYEYIETDLEVTHSFDVATVNAGIKYFPNYPIGTGRVLYPYMGVNVPVLDTNLSLLATIGHQDVQNTAGSWRRKYTDWSLGTQYNYDGFTLGLKYTDTDIEKEQCTEACTSGIVASISRSFDVF